MNANQLKFYKLFADFSKAEQTAATVGKYMTALINLDFAKAAEVWEYLAVTYEDGELYGDDVFELFYARSSKATVRLLNETPAVRRIVFGSSPAVGEGALLTVVTDLLTAGKVTEAEEIFKCVLKNPHAAFGPYMKQVVEKLFVEILKRNGNTRITMNRKVSALLLSYIAKIKTDERALLEQRIKEIS